MLVDELRMLEGRALAMILDEIREARRSAQAAAQLRDPHQRRDLDHAAKARRVQEAGRLHEA